MTALVLCPDFRDSFSGWGIQHYCLHDQEGWHCAVLWSAAAWDHSCCTTHCPGHTNHTSATGGPHIRQPPAILPSSVARPLWNVQQTILVGAQLGWPIAYMKNYISEMKIVACPPVAHSARWPDANNSAPLKSAVSQNSVEEIFAGYYNRKQRIMIWELESSKHECARKKDRKVRHCRRLQPHQALERLRSRAP